MKKSALFLVVATMLLTLFGCAAISQTPQAETQRCPECEYNFNNNGQLYPV